MNEDGRLACIFPTLCERNLAVDAMDLEVSVQNALKRSGIHDLAQLLQLSHPELLRIFPNRNLRSYEDVIHCLVRLSEGADTVDPDFVSTDHIGDMLKDAKKSDKKFNIFQVAEMHNDEIAHTSVIAELLNPQSTFHDKGIIFLDKFLRRLGIELSAEELADAKVQTEAYTDKKRRTDMVISAGSRYLPFEMKVCAGDQDKQLQDYYEFAKAQGAKNGQEVPCIYYLTLNTHEPSEQSRGNLSKDQIRRLSFKKDILRWLVSCMKEPDIPSDVLEIMKQLYDNIEGGFSKWGDVLADICRRLSKYELLWTECTEGHKIFTLNKKEFGKESLEFALRINKEKDKNKLGLYLIGGFTSENGKTDYSSHIYAPYNAGRYNELLEATFRDGGRTLGLKAVSTENPWDWLPKDSRYKGLSVETCYSKIEEIFEQLQPGLGPALATPI